MKSTVAALSVALLLTSGTARAYDTDGLNTPQTPESSSPPDILLAHKHFDDGIDLYRHGRFDLAFVEFEATYAITHEPDLLHNLSQTAEKLGRFADALQFEERFLAAKRADLTQSELDQTAGRIARLRERLTVNVKPATDAPTRHPVPAGSIGLLVGGGLLLIGGIGTGAAALSTQKTLQNGGEFFTGDYQALVDRGNALNSATIALDVIGGVALAAGAVWAIVDRVRVRRSVNATAAARQGTAGESIGLFAAVRPF